MPLSTPKLPHALEQGCEKGGEIRPLLPVPVPSGGGDTQGGTAGWCCPVTGTWLCPWGPTHSGLADPLAPPAPQAECGAPCAAPQAPSSPCSIVGPHSCAVPHVPHAWTRLWGTCHPQPVPTLHPAPLWDPRLVGGSHRPLANSSTRRDPPCSPGTPQPLQGPQSHHRVPGCCQQHQGRGPRARQRHLGGDSPHPPFAEPWLRDWGGQGKLLLSCKSRWPAPLLGNALIALNN